MFYLTTHSTHIIYGYMASDMVKDHYDNEKGNLLPPHRLLFPINSTYHGLCYTSRGALAGTRIAQWVHPMKDRSDDPSHHERTLLPRSYISLLKGKKSKKKSQRQKSRTIYIYFFNDIKDNKIKQKCISSRHNSMELICKLCTRSRPNNFIVGLL